MSKWYQQIPRPNDPETAVLVPFHPASHNQCSLYDAHMCTRTQVMRRAHTRKLGAHINVPFNNVFCTHFMHVIPNSDLFRQNVAKNKFDVHTDFKNLEGTLVTTIHSFITEMYIAPLQGYYSEALPTVARLRRRVLRLE